MPCKRPLRRPVPVWIPALGRHRPKLGTGVLSGPRGCAQVAAARILARLSFHAVQSQTVPEDLHGIQLADFLERCFPQWDRVQLRRLALDGSILVNRTAARPQQRLHAGDWVELGAGTESLRSRAVAPGLPVILCETATLLVIDKPAGMPVVPDRFRRQDVSVHALLPELRADADLRIVHRLDRDTSGCLMLAKGLAAARHCDLLFRDGRVHKQYLALIAGAGPVPENIELWLGPDPSRHGKVVASATAKKGFREASTAVTVESTFPRHTLVRLTPRTGRGHQLRVHLAAIGRPIVGDADYGGEELLLSQLKRRYKQRPGQVERPLLARMFLHAEQLACSDVDGRELAVTAPLPEDLRLVLAKLERFAAPRR